MTREATRTDISNAPELLRMADEVRREGRPRVLTRDNQELVEVSPITPKRRASKRARPVTEDDPLFTLIGIGESNVPGGLSGRKHEAQAEAHRRHLNS
jgi:hypothetical protein